MKQARFKLTKMDDIENGKEHLLATSCDYGFHDGNICKINLSKLIRKSTQVQYNYKIFGSWFGQNLGEVRRAY